MKTTFMGLSGAGLPVASVFSFMRFCFDWMGVQINGWLLPGHHSLKGKSAMNMPQKLRHFLKDQHVPFDVIHHPRTFSSAMTAHVEHVSGRNYLKTVMVSAEGQSCMLVLPSSHTVDLVSFCAETGFKEAHLQSEVEFKYLFPDCETGTMPPFGRLYNIPCFVDESVEGLSEVYFNAGRRSVTVRMDIDDFLRMLDGRMYDFAVPGQKLMV